VLARACEFESRLRHRKSADTLFAECRRFLVIELSLETALPELYTIGYEGVSQDALLQTLLFHDVQTLLDIRQLPQSRKPGLSKTALGLAAAERGIQYAHLRVLGTPRDIRYRRKIDHDEAAFREGFLEYLATQDEAMSALVTRAGQERCCLLCYEANVQECHRLLVAERAHKMSGGILTAVHLAVVEHGAA